MDFNTPGIFKLWNNHKIIENKYNSIFDIPIMTLSRKEIMIPKTTKPLFIVIFKNSLLSETISDKLKAINKY